MQKRIAISMGDYNGIGPEAILKILPQVELSDSTPVILGNISVFNFYAKRFSRSFSSVHYMNSIKDIKEGQINLLQCVNDDEISIEPGEISKQAGLAAMKAIETGIDLCIRDETQALVTAPISKEAVNLAGYHIPGHTEFLARKTGTEQYLMLLVYEQLRVGMVTTHIPVSQVSTVIKTENVLSSIKMIHQILQNDFNIETPHIAVMG